MIFKTLVIILLALTTFNTFVTMALFFAWLESQRKGGTKDE